MSSNGTWWERLRWGTLLYRTHTRTPRVGSHYIDRDGNTWRITHVRWWLTTADVWGRPAERAR